MSYFSEFLKGLEYLLYAGLVCLDFMAGKAVVTVLNDRSKLINIITVIVASFLVAICCRGNIVRLFTIIFIPAILGLIVGYGEKSKKS